MTTFFLPNHMTRLFNLKGKTIRKKTYDSAVCTADTNRTKH